MSKGAMFVDLVCISPAVASSGEVASLFEFQKDHLHRSLGNSHSVGDEADRLVGVLPQADQHVRVVGKKRPPGFRHAPGRYRGCRALLSTCP